MYLSTALFANKKEFLSSSFFIQLFVLVYVSDMKTDVLRSSSINLGKMLACQPNIFIGKAHVHVYLALFVLVKYYFVLFHE